MNSNVPDLTTIILNLLNQHSIFSNTNSESKTQEITPTATATTTDQDNNRQYYFIVFNNPRWSKIIQKRKPQMERQQQQPIQKTADSSSSASAKGPTQDTSVDDQFIADLRKLINDYLQRTTRPFPLRYFIDLTDQC